MLSKFQATKGGAAILTLRTDTDSIGWQGWFHLRLPQLRLELGMVEKDGMHHLAMRLCSRHGSEFGQSKGIWMRMTYVGP